MADKNIIKQMHDRLDKVRWRSIFSMENALDNIFNIIGAILVLAIAHVIGSLISRMMTSIAKSYEEDRISLDDLDIGSYNPDRGGGMRRSIILSMLGKFLYVTSILIGFIIMLRMFGLEIATIVTAVGTLAIVIALSLQGTFNDVVSGLLLAFFQTYDIGDIIELKDMEGRVVDFGVVNTLVEHMSTRALITIPNTTIQNSIVANYSKHRHHMFVFDVTLSGNQKDFAGLIKSLREDMEDREKYPDIVRHPSITNSVGINDLSGQGTVLRIRVPFLVSSDLNTKRTNVRTAVRETLDRLGAQKLDTGYDYVILEKNNR
jgi:small-conductance mechanosensitive channel